MNHQGVEILEFVTGGNHYGINVAKIREILPYQPITPIPNGHDYIEGVIMPRDTAFTIVNLRKCLGMADAVEKGYFIVTNFNNLDIAFHVDDVTVIRRVLWEDIAHPDVAHIGEEEDIATGMIKIKDPKEAGGKEILIVILDFERIVADIHLEKVLNASEIDVDPERMALRSHANILVAEDSLTLSQLLTDCLKKAGYTNQTLVRNGQEAWEIVNNEDVHCVITDLEMPLMDGHQLLNQIKGSEKDRHIPVILFSSIVSEQMHLKGEELGADAQLTKPEAGHLVETIDRLLGV